MRVSRYLFIAIAAAFSTACLEPDNNGRNGGNLNNNGGGGGEPTCTSVATWSPTAQLGAYISEASYPFNSADAVVELSSTRYQSLVLQDFHFSETYPKTTTFAAADTYAACDTCLFLLDQCEIVSNELSCETMYFQSGGTVTITRADANASEGQFIATGTDLVLTEWRFNSSTSTESRVADGRCYEIGSASWNASWPAATGS